jgi:hypothetical protein
MAFSMSFKTDHYKILPGVLTKDVAELAYRYLLNKRKIARFLFDEYYISPYCTEWGTWTDPQIPNTWSHYADPLMETILEGLKPLMEEQSELKLFETYSYVRIYKKGDILKRHKDRFSCEVSTTLNLGGDSWPIYLEPTGKENEKGIKVDLKPGDMLMYRGCELEHWREPFTGENCAQVFLHYNDASSKNAVNNMFDKRPFLGLPSYFQSYKVLK